MKKIALLLIFISLSWASVGQISIKASDFTGNVKTPVIEGNSGRSIPPGTLLYSQSFSCPPINGLASVTNFFNTYGPIECGDDFIVSTNVNISAIRWWFYMGDNPLTTNWIIRIYNDNNCLPSGLLGTYNISAADVNSEYVCANFGLNIYDCWADLGTTFLVQANTVYWITIQAEGTFDFWSIYGNHGQYLNCPGAGKFPTFGYFDFVHLNNPSFYDADADFSFEIYGEATSPGAVPVSNWAIGIGIFLILTLAVLRFRKMA